MGVPFDFAVVFAAVVVGDGDSVTLAAAICRRSATAFVRLLVREPPAVGVDVCGIGVSTTTHFPSFFVSS